MRLYYWNAYGYNFGDAMSPHIVEAILGTEIAKLDGTKLLTERRFEKNLFALGSIFHRVRNGDVVWGTGINPKHPPFSENLRSIDIRAVRGPLTRSYLEDKLGLKCPEIYGDPALLLPLLFPSLKPSHKKKYGIVPHLMDLDTLSSNHLNVISPKQDWKTVVQSILECDLIISSSLHGLIVAEAFGIPARWLHNQDLPSSKTEGTFKYNDYYASTHRSQDDWSISVEAALKVGGKEPISHFATQKLLDSFPHELFQEPRYQKSLTIAGLEDIHTSTIRIRHNLKRKIFQPIKDLTKRN